MNGNLDGRTARCLEVTGLISAYVDGEVTPSERSLVERHLPECRPCRSAHEQLGRVVALVGSLPEASVSPAWQQDLLRHARGASGPAATFLSIPSLVPALGFAAVVVAVLGTSLPDPSSRSPGDVATVVARAGEAPSSGLARDRGVPGASHVGEDLARARPVATNPDAGPTFRGSGLSGLPELPGPTPVASGELPTTARPASVRPAAETAPVAGGEGTAGDAGPATRTGEAPGAGAPVLALQPAPARFPASTPPVTAMGFRTPSDFLDRAEPEGTQPEARPRVAAAITAAGSAPAAGLPPVLRTRSDDAWPPGSSLEDLVRRHVRGTFELTSGIEAIQEAAREEVRYRFHVEVLDGPRFLADLSRTLELHRVQVARVHVTPDELHLNLDLGSAGTALGEATETLYQEFCRSPGVGGIAAGEEPGAGAGGVIRVSIPRTAEQP